MCHSRASGNPVKTNACVAGTNEPLRGLLVVAPIRTGEDVCEYPHAFDGMAKSLSFDMRIIEPAWAAAKLRHLLSYAEPQGDFLAWVPGADRQASYPSMVAYIAWLVIHRYAMLGISECGKYAVIKNDVCDFCNACGATGGVVEAS